MAGIHPTALIGPDVTIGDDVTIEPYAFIDGKVTIGQGTTIGASTRISGHTTIGKENKISSNVVIGAPPQDLSYSEKIKSETIIGDSNTIREFSSIHRSAIEGGKTTLGNQNFLMAGAHLAHDTIVGNHNILANNVLLGGHVEVGDRAFLGGGAGFHQFVKVGSFAMVQGNSAISKDMPPYCIANQMNNLRGLNTIGLKRGGFTSDDLKEVKALFRLLFRSAMPLAEAISEADKKTWSDKALLLLTAAKHPSRKGLIIR